MAKSQPPSTCKGQSNHRSKAGRGRTHIPAIQRRKGYASRLRQRRQSYRKGGFRPTLNRANIEEITPNFQMNRLRKVTTSANLTTHLVRMGGRSRLKLLREIARARKGMCYRLQGAFVIREFQIAMSSRCRPTLRPRTPGGPLCH